MTPAGYEKLQQELKQLKAVERPRIMQAIEEARAHGDLTENAEYDAAKEKQQQLEARIREIEDKLARAQVIQSAGANGKKVVFGARVLIRDSQNGKTASYLLVGEDEADFSQGKISIRSPLARGMIGKQPGDVFYVQAPGGEREYTVEDVLFD